MRSDQHPNNSCRLPDSENTEPARVRSREIGAANATDSKGLIEAGEALLRLGQYDEALEVYREAMSLAPDQPEAYYRVSWAHFGKKEWREAEFYAEKAVSLAPDVTKYHLAAAACAQKRRDLEAVLVHLEAAKRANPLELDGRAHWALAYSRIFAGLEKLGLLMGWATLATIYACTFSVANLWCWFLVASVPFLAASGWNFRKRRYRPAIWALVLCVLWAVPTYLLVERLLGR